MEERRFGSEVLIDQYLEAIAAGEYERADILMGLINKITEETVTKLRAAQYQLLRDHACSGHYLLP